MALVLGQSKEGKKLMVYLGAFVQRPADRHAAAINDESKIHHNVRYLWVPFLRLQTRATTIVVRHKRRMCLAKAC
jgi:hypothetical protein